MMMLPACAPQKTPPAEEPTPEQQQPQEVQGLTINEEYVIVFPQKYDLHIDRATYALQSAIKDKTGVNIKVVNEREQAQAKEIVIGYCNRFEQSSVSAPISVQGEKIIFAVPKPAKLYCIVDAFVDQCLRMGAVDAEGHLLLTEDVIARVASAETAYDNKITVLTQNLRYRDDEGGNSVAERSERFLELALDYKPDIIGTQEATPLWTSYLQEHFSDEYGMVGVFRDGTGNAGDEANYILYRKDRFTLEESGTFWLNPEEPDKVGKIKDALCNRICTWALLTDNQTGKMIFACNTHLDHSTDAIRAAQLEVLLEQLSYEVGYYPFILTGDFNMLRDSAPYKSVTKAGLLDGQRNAWVDDSEVDHSCHLYTDDGEIIDYCFYSTDFLPFYAKIINDDYGGYVSDHYGVLVELVPTTSRK